jgi:biopolymer transport protein ExbD
MDYGLQVDVPKTVNNKESPEVLPVVTITDNQILRLNKVNVNINDLPAQLEKRFKGQKIVYVACDKSVRWDVLAQVLAELSRAQIVPRMVTKPLDGKGR